MPCKYQQSRLDEDQMLLRNGRAIFEAPIFYGS